MQRRAAVLTGDPVPRALLEGTDGGDDTVS